MTPDFHRAAVVCRWFISTSNYVFKKEGFFVKLQLIPELTLVGKTYPKLLWNGPESLISCHLTPFWTRAVMELVMAKWTVAPMKQNLLTQQSISNIGWLGWWSYLRKILMEDFSFFHHSRNLAIGIGIQNFPEGLAVSLPLRGAGVDVWTAFWWGTTVVSPPFSRLKRELKSASGTASWVGWWSPSPGCWEPSPLSWQSLSCHMRWRLPPVRWCTWWWMTSYRRLKSGEGTRIFRDWQRNGATGYSYTQERKQKTRVLVFFYNLSLLHQWQWKAGLLDFHSWLRGDDVAGRGLGLTTHQREHHQSASELFFKKKKGGGVGGGPNEVF